MQCSERFRLGLGANGGAVCRGSFKVNLGAVDGGLGAAMRLFDG